MKTKFNIVCHYPPIEKKRELTTAVSKLHAEIVINKVKEMNIPTEKIKEIINIH